MRSMTAKCQCGSLQVRLEGEPARVALCCCTECQRRTGSVYGVGAYFSSDQVKVIAGLETIYTRSSDAERWIRQHFCPCCGTTVYWEAEFRPGMVGVAYGALDSQENLVPTVAVWTNHKADWVTLPAELGEHKAQG